MYRWGGLGGYVSIETDFPLYPQANKGSSEMEKVALVSAASTQLQVRAERQQLVRASRLLLLLVWLLLWLLLLLWWSLLPAAAVVLCRDCHQQLQQLENHLLPQACGIIPALGSSLTEGRYDV